MTKFLNMTKKLKVFQPQPVELQRVRYSYTEAYIEDQYHIYLEYMGVERVFAPQKVVLLDVHERDSYRIYRNQLIGSVGWFIELIPEFTKKSPIWMNGIFYPLWLPRGSHFFYRDTPHNSLSLTFIGVQVAQK